MLKEFTKKNILLVGSTFLVLAIFFAPNVYATLYNEYTETTLTITWLHCDNCLVQDVDSNGYADRFYERDDLSTPAFTLLLGDGDPSPTAATVHATLNFDAGDSIQTEKDLILIAEHGYSTGGGNTNFLHTTNTTSGSFSYDVLATSCYIGSGTGGQETYRNTATGMMGVSGEPILATGCSADSIYGLGRSEMTTMNATGLICNTNSGNESADLAIKGSSTHISHDWNNSGCTNTGLVITGAGDLPSGSTGGATMTGMCNEQGCHGLEFDTTNIKSVDPVTTRQASEVVVDASILLASGGYFMPQSHEGDHPNVGMVLEEFWSDMIVPNDGTCVNKLRTLHYEILEPTLTKDVYRFMFDNGTKQYFGYVDNFDVKYIDITSFCPFDGYTTASYLMDTNPALVSSAFTTTDAPTYTHDLTTPTGVTTTTSSQHGFTLPSGYLVKPDPTTSRQIDPRFIEDDGNFVKPYILGSTTSQTALSLVIQNAPNSAAIEARDESQNIDAIKYLWSSEKLAGDHSVTVDLPASKCVDFWIKDLSIQESLWSQVGSACASGAMPKTLIFQQNLAFTFWTLPYGAAHEYLQPTTNLVTKVRADEQPFDYTVNVYHNNGTLFNSTSYTGVTTNATTFDQRQFNASGADFPSRMEILDGTGSIIYYATIGFPNYFSSISSYYAQWFEVDGFNLLYMLPIIFAAMFTRNTVGIGTGMTVAFISVLAWTGIIVIDEIVVYALIFIAILGMLAYRQLR